MRAGESGAHDSECQQRERRTHGRMSHRRCSRACASRTSSNSSSTVDLLGDHLLLQRIVDDPLQRLAVGLDAEAVRVERALRRRCRRRSRAVLEACGTSPRRCPGAPWRSCRAPHHVVDRHAAVLLRPVLVGGLGVGDQRLEARVGELVADQRGVDLAVDQHLRQLLGFRRALDERRVLVLRDVRVLHGGDLHLDQSTP